ncbi:MAG: hypothetical protein ACR2J5_05360 [Geodermatophilaceae bacterium]
MILTSNLPFSGWGDVFVDQPASRAWSADRAAASVIRGALSAAAR